MQQKIDRPWRDYPVGTKAHASTGGHWTKTERGWTWIGGSTFPTPGADAFAVTLPEADPCPHGVSPGAPAGPCRVCHLEKSLHAIRDNAKSQIDGMNSLNVPDDAPERIAATWYYREAHYALLGV